jgi:hypothetical protein
MTARDEKLEETTREQEEDNDNDNDNDIDLEVAGGVVQHESFRLRTSMQWEILGLQERDAWYEVKEILESSPTEELLSPKDLERLAVVKNQEGICLLWIAMEHDVSLEVVRLLIEADKESACLLDAKVLKEFIEKYLLQLIKGNFGVGYSLEYQQELAQEWTDSSIAKPLVCFILDGASSSKTSITHKELRVPAQVYSYLAKSITRSKNLQQLVNKETTRRSMVALLFLDLYSQVATIGVFMFVSDSYLKDIRLFQGKEIELTDIGDGAYYNFLYALVVYFFLEESHKIWSIGFWESAMDLWNLFDIFKSVLLLVSTITMQNGVTLDYFTDEDFNDFSDIRTLMTFTGGVLFLSLILFLRNTFLSFSNFVTGTVHVSTICRLMYAVHSSIWVIKVSSFSCSWVVSFRS